MPVERVRDVDEPALALDLGDRLLERHPARDLLLDEEADHLALRRRLDLLADDHLDAVLRGLARASMAPETSLWSVTAIAPSPRRGPRPAALHRRRAVVRVVGVHVQVDVDQVPAPRRRARPSSPRRVAPCGEAVVDGLDLAGHAVPVEVRAPRRRGRAQALAQRRRRRPAARAGRTGRRRRPARTAAPPRRRRAPPRRGSREATGTAPPARARTSTPGRRRRARGGGDHHVGAVEPRRRLVVDEAHPLAQPAARRAERRAPPGT